MPSIKQIGTICFALSFIIFPKFTFADNEPTVIPTPANCNEAVLNTTEGSADLEAIYTANTINTTWYSGYGNNASVANATQCSYDGTINLPQTNPSRPGYAFNGWKLKACTVPSSLVSTNGSRYGYKNDSTGVPGAHSSNTSEYGLTEDNTWGVTWANGDKVKGIASCQPTLPADIAYIGANLESVSNGQMDVNTFITEYTAIAGAEKGAIMQQVATAYLGGDGDTAETLLFQLSSMPGDTNYTTNSTGQHCWCKVTSYTPSGGSQCLLSSSLWVTRFIGGNIDSSASHCANDCAADCADGIERFTSIRAAVFAGNVAQ